MWLTFKERTNLFTERLRMLHVRPGAVLGCAAGGPLPNVDYVSGDLSSRGRWSRWDLTAIDLDPTTPFDVIYASHVLEHITDDLQAMSGTPTGAAPRGVGDVAGPDVRACHPWEDPFPSSILTSVARRFGQR